jgi:hypothetical protein
MSIPTVNSSRSAEVDVQITIHPSPIHATRAKYEIEDSLAPLIEQIREEKGAQLRGRKMILLAARCFLIEAREKPWSTAAKATLVVFSTAALYPAVIGSIACMNGYRLANWNDLYSSDLDVATLASQLFSNLGQGVSFLIQGTHALIFTSCLLGGSSCDLARYRIITGIYNQLTQKIVSKEERDFINEMRKREFITYSNLNGIETKELKGTKLIEIKKQIEEEKKTQLTYRNIVYLTACEFVQETKKYPWTSAFKLSLVGIATAALHPCILGTIACLDAYRVENTNDLYSSNLTVANKATATLSNTGHVIEYLAGGMALMALSSKNLLQNSYKRALLKTTNDIFNKYIRDASLTKKESDLLYEMKQKEITTNGLINLKIQII